MWSVSDSLLTWASRGMGRIIGFVLATVLVVAASKIALTRMIVSDFEFHVEAALADAIITGVLTGAVAYILLRTFQAKRRRVLTYVRQVSELNHQVRNALQTMTYELDLTGQRHTCCHMYDSIRRIDEALRTIFPIIGERKVDEGVLRELLQ